MSYRYRDLTPAAQGWSVPRGLSQGGVVVGYCAQQSFIHGAASPRTPEHPTQFHAISGDGRFLAADTRLVDDWEGLLFDLEAGSSRRLGEGTRVGDVNSSGLVVGQLNGRGFTWIEGERREIAEARILLGVNEDGHAVGVGSQGWAVLVREGCAQQLAMPQGFESSAAYGIDDQGTVVGCCSQGRTFRPAVWTAPDQVELLEGQGVALGVHGSAVVGMTFERPPLGYDPKAPWAIIATSKTRAFLSQGGQMRPLPHGDLKVAVGINSAGQLIGWSTRPEDPRTKKAFLLEPVESTRPTVEEAQSSDLDAILALLPGIANFDLPPDRLPEHLWKGKAHLLRGWAEGLEPRLRVLVARADGLVGLAVARLGLDPYSRSPNAQLEIFLGDQELLQAMESRLREEGVTSLTIEVFQGDLRQQEFLGSYVPERTVHRKSI